MSYIIATFSTNRDIAYVRGGIKTNKTVVVIKKPIAVIYSRILHEFLMLTTVIITAVEIPKIINNAIRNIPGFFAKAKSKAGISEPPIMPIEPLIAEMRLMEKAMLVEKTYDKININPSYSA